MLEFVLMYIKMVSMHNKKEDKEVRYVKLEKNVYDVFTPTSTFERPRIDEENSFSKPIRRVDLAFDPDLVLGELNPALEACHLKGGNQM